MRRAEEELDKAADKATESPSLNPSLCLSSLVSPLTAAIAKAVSVDGDDEDDNTKARLESMAIKEEPGSSSKDEVQNIRNQIQRSDLPSADHLLRNAARRAGAMVTS